MTLRSHTKEEVTGNMVKVSFIIFIECTTTTEQFINFKPHGNQKCDSVMKKDLVAHVQFL